MVSHKCFMADLKCPQGSRLEDDESELTSDRDILMAEHVYSHKQSVL